MLQHNWTKLERKEASEVLAQLSSCQGAIVFSKDFTEVSYKTLPFYSHYKIYRLINYATMPTFSMFYLGNGKDFTRIDGLANVIYDINEKDNIYLTENNVISYLNFFFNSVQGSEGDVFLIRDPNKVPFIDDLPPEQKKDIIDCFEPVKLTLLTSPEIIFNITANILYGDAVIKTSIKITQDGEISFENQNLLLSGIYLLDNIYNDYERF